MVLGEKLRSAMINETHDDYTPTQRRMLELERLIAGDCCDGWLLASLCAEYYDLSIKQEE